MFCHYTQCRKKLHLQLLDMSNNIKKYQKILQVAAEVTFSAGVAKFYFLNNPSVNSRSGNARMSSTLNYFKYEIHGSLVNITLNNNRKP
ncbi:CLUMA_CG013434, isoform A [Clunio marinus]|uniref:CLUMA_CG013434, isoform A n=1 Tax=Clunio marinus TaxID=568069 RepID=A0A1J1IM56_9DIPT|nr:CLUMA_CG013434, isoform A [Clunio marinus]